MKYQILNAFTLISMLLVLSATAIRADEGIAESKPALSVYPYSEEAIDSEEATVVDVDEKDLLLYQVLLAEIKTSEGFIRSVTPVSPFDVQFVVQSKSTSVFVDALIKSEMLSIVSSPHIATLIDRKAHVVIGDSISLYEIELLPERRGDDIRTAITLTYSEMRDGKVHRSYQMTAFHIQQTDTTILMCGKLGDKDMLVTIGMRQRKEKE